MAKPAAVRITTARTSTADDMHARKVRYAVSMSIRTVCFVAAVVVGQVIGHGWLMWTLIAAAVFLPFFAVVIANAGDQRDDGFMLRDSHPAHELTARTDQN